MVSGSFGGMTGRPLKVEVAEGLVVDIVMEFVLAVFEATGLICLEN